MDTLDNATPPPAAAETMPWDEPYVPQVGAYLGVVQATPLRPSCWRSDASGLIAALHITDGLHLMFASGDNDADTVGNIDHLIDGLQQLRRLVVTLQSDPAIVAAVSEQVTRA